MLGWQRGHDAVFTHRGRTDDVGALAGDGGVGEDAADDLVCERRSSAASSLSLSDLSVDDSLPRCCITCTEHGAHIIPCQTRVHRRRVTK